MHREALGVDPRKQRDAEERRLQSRAMLGELLLGRGFSVGP